jgi:hypothetical protein
MELTGLAYDTLSGYAMVAGRFTIGRRRLNLSFSHHQEVFSLGSDVEQDEWLDKAAQEGWSSKELRKALSEGGTSGATGGRSNQTDDVHASPPSENAVLASTLEALRMTLDLEDAQEISARSELEGISASAWLRRYLDELRVAA